MGRTKQELIFYGDSIRIEQFPEQTRILYPPDSLPTLTDPKKAVEQAINNPLGSKPLSKLVKSNSRITIAFDDLCVYPMVNDVRQLAIEIILEELYKYGAERENIKLICARGLHRRMTSKEFRAILGKRIPIEFGGQIVCHDAEDKENIVFLGNTDKGEIVETNKSLVDSDITIYVSICNTSMNGGWKSEVCGFGTYNSLKWHHNPVTLEESRSLLDPDHSELHNAINRMGKVLEKKIRVFAVEFALNNCLWPNFLKDFLTPIGKRSSAKLNSATCSAIRLGQILPDKIKRTMMERFKSYAQPIAVHAGQVDMVHERTLESIYKQQTIQTSGQSDVLILGVPNLSPYSVYSCINPILVMDLALGYFLNFYLRKPLIKENGVCIIYNPCIKQFHKEHHSSYFDFFEYVLSQTTDPQQIHDLFEEKYANDPRYIDKYRNQYSFHGVHPFFAWYWASYALKHLHSTIVAGAKEPQTAERLGFIPAKTLEQAIDMAKDIKGKNCSIAYPFIPSVYVTEVCD